MDQVHESNSKNGFVSRELSQGTVNEEEYFRSSESLGKENDCQIRLKSSLPFNNKVQFNKSDFEILGLLGRGSYARVVKARLIKEDKIFAIKIVDRVFIENV